MCFLSNDIYDYYNVSQGKVTIPNVDDGEECQLTDVSFLSLDLVRSSTPCEHQFFLLRKHIHILKNETVWNSTSRPFDTSYLCLEQNRTPKIGREIFITTTKKRIKMNQKLL